MNNMSRMPPSLSQRMSRRSGNRFADKDMRHFKKSRAFPGSIEPGKALDQRLLAAARRLVTGQVEKLWTR
jgi:hypothetical protein